MTHLFLFTIGPVQGFIAQARKTRDLKAGSQLLSDLIRHAWMTAKAVDCVQVIKSIMPVLEAEDQAEGLPNRFLAEVAFDDESQAHQLGEQTAQAVKDKLVEIAMDLLDKKVKEAKGDFRARFEAQIRDHLEVHWVINQLGDDYKANYLETESLLGAVKATRTFEQLPADEAHRKCSVTGERDALVFSKTDTKRPSFSIQKDWATAKGDEIQMAEGEGLSAIAFTKRFYEKGGDFPSTADIALMEWVKQVKEHSPTELKELSLVFDREDKIDGQLLFEENLSERYLSKQGYASRAKSSDLIRGKLGKIKQVLPASVKQTPYYALIAFDGDKMGSWWSGDKPNPPDLKEFQRKLTRLLSKYAKWASDYLTDYGKAVYAGGDDFLGFINLQYLFPALKTLREEFKKQVSDQTGVANQELTFSAGVAIAHYKTPLNVVLDTARMMEKKAKEDGRNRLGIKVLKHSGEAETWVGTWSPKDGKGDYSVQHLALLVDAFLKKRCSNTFIGVLNRELVQITGLDPDKPGRMPKQTDTTLRQIARQEILRSLNRSLSPKVSAEEADALRVAIRALYELSSDDPSNFIFGLRIAQFIAREQFLPDSTPQPTPSHAN